MNFLDWMNMNMIIDITFIVFSGAVIWKLRQYNKIHNEIKKTNANFEEKLEMHKLAIIELIQFKESTSNHLTKVDKQIVDVTKNPQAARRKLKQAEQYSNIQ